MMSDLYPLIDKQAVLMRRRKNEFVLRSSPRLAVEAEQEKEQERRGCELWISRQRGKKREGREGCREAVKCIIFI
jgi:hypothetical protein